MSIVLSRLFIYPVKSLGGIELDRAHVTRRGLAHDRRFMVVDEQGLFVTQRELRKMASVQSELVGDSLRLHGPKGEPLTVPLEPQWGSTCTVEVWGSRVEALDLGPACAAWLRAVLGRPLRLVFMPDEVERAVSSTYGKPGDVVSFADGYPFLVLGEASLEDLQKRVQGELPVQRFRPNLVVRGSEPYAEDQWSEVHIGETPFRVVKPCSRCVITTLDHETGEAHGANPLKALAEYRRRDGKVLFAQNAIADADGGTLRCGDLVQVRSTRPWPSSA